MINASERALSDAYVFSALAFGAHAFVVLDGLTFVEAIEGGSFHSRGVEENVSIVSRNEAKALVHEFLNRSLRHVSSSPARIITKSRSPRTVQLRSGDVSSVLKGGRPHLPKKLLTTRRHT